MVDGAASSFFPRSGIFRFHLMEPVLSFCIAVIDSPWIVFDRGVAAKTRPPGLDVVALHRFHLFRIGLSLLEDQSGYKFDRRTPYSLFDSVRVSAAC